MNKKYIFLIVALIAATGLFAQENLSLANAVEIGLSNNFQIRIANSQAEIARNNNSWGQTNALPTVGVNAGFNLNISDQSQNPTSFIQERIQTTGVDYGASLNWTLFDGFAMFASKRQLELLEAQSEGNAQLIVENAIQAIILAYVDAQVQKEKLAVLSEVIGLSKDRLEYMEVKRELGASTTFEILQFENAIITDSTNYLLQELALKNAIRNLNLLMGESPETQWTLTNELEAPQSNFTFDAIWMETVNRNQQLRNVVINKLLSEQGTKLAQASLYPVVGFNAGASQSDNNFEAGELSASGRTLNYFGAFTLNFNLFNGGKTRRSIQNARINEEIALLGEQELRLNVESELRNSFDLFQAQQAIFELTEESVVNQAQALNIAQERFTSAAINSFDFRAQQVSYLNANLARIEALRNLITTNTNLTRLRGGLIQSVKN